MLRLFTSCCAVALLVCFVGGLQADDKDAKDAKSSQAKGKKVEAQITKVDPKAGTVTVKMKNKEGKEVERTFKLTGEIRYFDSTGKVAAVDIFRSGDYVLVVEEEGRLRELHKDKNKEKLSTKDKEKPKPEKK